MSLPNQDFYFIRHGQTDWNLQNKCMGQQDIPLNQTGIEEIQLAKELLRHSPIQTICYSPLKRAKQSAEIIQDVLQCNLVEIDSLKECSWGDYEGEHKGDRTFFKLWMQGTPHNGAESYPAFLERALEGITQALNYPTPLIVAHGGIYWAVLTALKQQSTYSGSIPNAIPIYHKAPRTEHDLWHIAYLDDLYDIEPFSNVF